MLKNWLFFSCLIFGVLANDSDDLFEEYFQWKMQEFPERAASLGVENAPVKLGDFSIEAINAQKEKVVYFNQKAEELLEAEIVSTFSLL